MLRPISTADLRLPLGGLACQYPFGRRPIGSYFRPLGVVQRPARSEQGIVDLVVVDEDRRSVERDDQRVSDRRVDVGVLSAFVRDLSFD